MLLEYESLAEAREKFKWSDRWKAFDRDQENLNIAYECVDRHPEEKTAIRLVHSDGSLERFTFGELSRRTSQFANMLADKGLQPGDRIAVVLNPSIEYYISFFGALKFGAVAVPCYPLLGSEGVMYRIESAGAKLVVVSSKRAEIIPSDAEIDRIMAEDLISLIAREKTVYEPETSADKLAVIQFSSGSTGLPKQVLYTHMAMTITAVFVKLWIGLRSEDVFMCTSSPAWGHGVWYGTVGPMIFGN
ncbi:MAG: acyl-CoA synthetase, partial [Proteobacteria bacterium]|nr:acyl-CoA synthetase [Pseudomonadota bacterium]